MSLLLANLTEERLKKLISDLYWYQTIEFPKNIITRATYNHKPYLKYYGFPNSLKNMSVLDVGAGDGFFSFEFERRDAQKVLAIDTNIFDGSMAIDPSHSKIENYGLKYSIYKTLCKEYYDILKLLKTPGLNQLLIAKDLLNSNINYQNFSIYNLDSLGKKFDFIFCGDLMQHLKNPLLALENLVSVTKKLCIISLGSSISKIKKPSATFKIYLRKFLKKFFLHDIIEPKHSLKYIGNESGGAFFFWHPYSFREALYASGFEKVIIYSEFDLPNLRRRTINSHTIFHCYV